MRNFNTRVVVGLTISLLSGFLVGCASARQPVGTLSKPAAPAQTEKSTNSAAGTTTSNTLASAAETEDPGPPPIKLPEGASKPPAAFEGTGWEEMFDGHSLDGWRETSFAGRGPVQCHSGVLILGMGDPFTGVNYTNKFPTMNYEIALDAMRVSGSDFFCGLTIPVGESHCSVIVGGWGGSLFGISSLDGMDASENETTKFVTFETGKWYRLRLRVTEKRIEGWVNDEQMINVTTTDRKISVRAGEIELSKPVGIASWQTTSALREIRYRKIDGPAGPPRKGF